MYLKRRRRRYNIKNIIPINLEDKNNGNIDPKNNNVPEHQQQ